MSISRIFPNHQPYQKDLVAAADKALYQSVTKREPGNEAKGRNTYCFHTLGELRMTEWAIN
ncbi:MAG: hypothetical protein EBE86_000405 [Hormoscilla sp. GUM202]|nr:hypothetical protein [Hormoscilla sp. GUM202]